MPESRTRALPSKQQRIEKRKRMDALFDRGQYIYFTGDGEGRVLIRKSKDDADPDDLRIWVRPASPIQREMIVREAQAERARRILTAKDPDSNDYVTTKGYVATLSFEALVDYVLELDESTRITEARRDVLKEKEWEDFNTLRDAMRQYDEAGAPSDDPEWKPLLERDAEFGRQVSAQAGVLRENASDATKLMPRERLEDRAWDKRIDQMGNAAFMESYEAWTLYFACRDDEDHATLFFDDVNDLKSQPQELQDALSDLLASFIQEAGEAKNSQAVESGSDSSTPPDEPETSEPSGPEDASESTTSPGISATPSTTPSPS